MIRIATVLFQALTAVIASAQLPSVGLVPPSDDPTGPLVRIKDIARLRGVRSNQLMNVGVVVGLEGTGDSRNSPGAQTAIANMVKEFGISLDLNQLNLKNVALVLVTAELPPFARPGNRVDVTVSSIGDAKSLQGGYLIQTPLYPAGDKSRAYAVAMGPISIGGFNVQQGGSKVQKNHVNVGTIPGGAIVERGVDTQYEFDGRFVLELMDPDFTTAERMANAINQQLPDLSAVAVDGGGVEVFSREGAIVDPVSVLARIESVEVVPDTPAVIVINERTGTIVVGGNVKIAPAMVAHGGLTVRINQYNEVIQPLPLSRGETALQQNTEVAAKEERVNIGVVNPNATIEDLAKVFRALKVSPTTLIAILQDLRAQGAIKARIVIR
jgi:flagellar P-ring protein precursor FlgI